MQRHTPGSASRRRGGAIIIVVLALLTTLLVLGLFFYTWTSQEVANAESYASPDLQRSPAVDPNPTFGVMAEQLIVGTRDSYPNSALWGGVHSLLAHQIGRINSNLSPTDTNTRTGQGVVIRYTDSNNDGYPDVVPFPGTNAGGFASPGDFEFVYASGRPDVAASETRNIDSLVMNYSPLAQSGAVPNYRPDVDYTYPDINSLFLAHDEVVRDPTDSANRGIRVLIPSFFRPQYFPGMRSYNGSQSFLYLYSDNTFRGKVLRPHQGHVYANNDARYLTQPTTIARSGNRERVLRPFPFPAAASEAMMGAFSNVTTEAASGAYTLLDVDLDGDGVKDSIWLDLDLPMVRMPQGGQYIPMASFKIIDADGLLNLNAHGNLEGEQKLSRDNMSNEPLSVSNLGMSRSEVNPLWALNGDFTAMNATELQSALRNVLDRFPAMPVAAVTPMRLANMELFMLFTGWKPNAVAEQLTEGRYGDESDLNLNNRPLPGQRGVDDDSDNASDGGFGHPRSSDPDLAGISTPGFLHPIAPTGLGLKGFDTTDATPSSLIDVAGRGANRVMGQFSGSPGNPAAWIAYRNFQAQAGSLVYPNALATPFINNSLLDEENETVLEPGSSLYGLYDSPFPASETAALHLSDADLTRLSLTSRLHKLAAANFRNAANAEKVRSRFSTNSWDRLEFNYAAPLFRQWEWDGATSMIFPPVFTTAGGQVQPFRGELRTLFRTDVEGSGEFGASRISPRHRLNLNGILSDDSAGGGEAAFDNASPRYRKLVPHPNDFDTGDRTVLSVAFPQDGNITDPRLAFTNISADRYVQEWWARYDRQRLARDIYCLLWVLGCGDDGVDPLDANPYSVPQAREMAQFAVNVVDAMDADHVLTRFAYDPNLSDGWDTTAANLSVVYGVEHQELAFNETLFIETDRADSNDSKTEYDDEEDGAMDDTVAGKYFFSFVELRNAAPWPVKIDNGMWRIRRISLNTAETELFKATLLRTGSPTSTVPEEVAGGGELLIGCQSGDNRYTSGSGTPRPSEFRIDVAGDGRFESIVPNIEETDIPTTGTPEASRIPLCDLDLIHPNHAACVQETIGPTTSLLNRINFSGATTVRLVLERRLRSDPHAGSANAMTDAMNPWIEVDRVDGDIRRFNIANVGNIEPSSNPPEDAELRKLTSQERREPFDSGIDPVETPNPQLTMLTYNGTSLGQQGRHTLPFHERALKANGERRNSRVNGTQYVLWQPHFDRDFSSVIELLSVPLFGQYQRETAGTPWQRAVHGGTARNIAEPGGALRMSGHRTAAIRILNPQGPAATLCPLPDWLEQIAAIPEATHYSNRWYRLLEFVEVKSQDQLYSDSITGVQRRTPGKLNLNTIRDESVFAGLIDDPFHIDPRNKMFLQTSDRYESSRNWFIDHRRSRDGVDPFMVQAGLPNITIPGGFFSRPFRSLSFLDRPVSSTGSSESANLSVQSTVLRMRSTALDSGTGSLVDQGRGLYEARHIDDIADCQIDYHTKQRILSKIANNSTTRSHVFIVWMGIDYFEAHENDNGRIQIGGLAEQDVLPSRRMFMVVDMSRLEEAYNTDSTPPTFDYRKFILHRQLIE